MSTHEIHRTTLIAIVIAYLSVAILVTTYAWLAASVVTTTDRTQTLSWMPPLFVLSAGAVLFSVTANVQGLDRVFYTWDLRMAAASNLHDLLAGSSVTTPGREPAYLFFLSLVSKLGNTTTILYSSVALVCLSIYLWALRRALTWAQTTFVLAITVSLGFFTSYTGLVIRQGLSMAFMFAGMALLYFGKPRVRAAVGLFAVSALFHWSALPFVFFSVVARFGVIKRRFIVIIWILAASLFVLGQQQRLLGPLAKLVPRSDMYTDPSLGSLYLGGVNRTSFLVFSILIGFIGLAYSSMFDLPQWYERILISYFMLSSIFFLFGYVYYSDRLAAYSWYLAPLILSAPVFAQGRKQPQGALLILLASSLFFGFAKGPFGLLPNMI